MGIVPSCGVSTQMGGYALVIPGASTSSTSPVRLRGQCPADILWAVVPCKIPVQGCTVYIDYKPVCTKELSMGTKTYHSCLSVKQIEHRFSHNNREKQK